MHTLEGTDTSSLVRGVFLILGFLLGDFFSAVEVWVERLCGEFDGGRQFQSPDLGTVTDRRREVTRDQPEGAFSSPSMANEPT